MEVKINREIRNYTESMFFGLSIPFIKHIPIAIVMSISHISGCATICGKESNEISPVCF